MKRKKRSARNCEHLFGINPVWEALRAGRRKFYRITVKRGIKPGKNLLRIIETAARRGIPLDRADIDMIAKLVGGGGRREGHQGVVALVSAAHFTTLDKLIEASLRSASPTLAVLDCVTDPGNFGAIIRSAEVFGIDGVIFPSNRAVGYTPVSAKASAGAGEHMRLCRVTNLAETIKRLRAEGFECIALDQDGDEIFSMAPEGPLALVIGGEGNGVRPLVMKRCGRSARIPMKGSVSSLNVSSAGAVAFYLASIR